MTITRLNYSTAATGKADELHAFLISLVPYISGSPGCRSCIVLRKSDAPDQFCVIEKWDSIEAHKASIAAFPKDKIAAAMPLFGAPPTGDYYEN